MASIDLRNVSVSYYMQPVRLGSRNLEQGPVGAPIIAGGRYLEIAALEEISISLRDGDRVGLIGLNGSGKSTLLKVCAGALTARSGEIRIDGKVSPQFSLGAGIRPALSGRRNAELKCLYMGIAQRSIEKRVEEIKALSGLGGYFELPVSSYSAGMRSRLVMCLMKLVRGEILIVDEWIGAADATVNSTVSDLQSDLIQSSSILLLASHSERVLARWTKKLIWLHRGRIRQMGAFDEVYLEYERFLQENEAARPAIRSGRKRNARVPARPRTKTSD